jgi:hypothetical protein
LFGKVECRKTLVAKPGKQNAVHPTLRRGWVGVETLLPCRTA